ALRDSRHAMTGGMGIGGGEVDRPEPQEVLGGAARLTAEEPGETCDVDLESDAPLRDLQAETRGLLDAWIPLRMGEDRLKPGCLEGEYGVVRVQRPVDEREIDKHHIRAGECRRFSLPEPEQEVGRQSDFKASLDDDISLASMGLDEIQCGA